VVWDLLNFLVAMASAAIHVFYNLLPGSPLYLASADIAAVAAVAGYAAFFLPVALMFATLAAFVTVLVAWVAVLLTIQFVEAITP
jgi:hypothetical protein